MTHETSENGRHPADMIGLDDLETVAAGLLVRSIDNASVVTSMLQREHPDGIPDHLYLMIGGLGAFTLRHHELVGVRQHDIDELVTGVSSGPTEIWLGLAALAPSRADLQEEYAYWSSSLVAAYKTIGIHENPSAAYWGGFIKPVVNSLTGISPINEAYDRRRALLAFCASVQQRSNGRLRSGLGLGKFLDNQNKPVSQEITEHYLKYCYKSR